MVQPLAPGAPVPQPSQECREDSEMRVSAGHSPNQPVGVRLGSNQCTRGAEKLGDQEEARQGLGRGPGPQPRGEAAGGPVGPRGADKACWCV